MSIELGKPHRDKKVKQVNKKGHNKKAVIKDNKSTGRHIFRPTSKKLDIIGIISLGVTLIFVVVAIYFVTTIPNNISYISNMKLQSTNILDRYKKSISNLEEQESEFISNRSFEIAYNDIDTMIELFDSVSGISISKVVELDALNGFSEVGEYTTGGTPNAVEITMNVADINSALKSINKAELAINDIEIVEPNTIILRVLLRGVE